MARKRRRKRGRSTGGVSRRALLAALGLGSIGTASAYETGAFDAVAGERPFDIATAADGEALLGIEIQKPTGDDGDEVTLLTLTNQFDGPLESISASVASSSSAPVDASRLDVPDQLTAGESAPITAPLACESGGGASVEVSISITASGPDESVELTRPVPVTCRVPSSGVCDPRSIPPADEGPISEIRTTEDGVSVDFDATEDDVKITGNVTIRGALDISSDDTITVKYRGSGSVREYFRIAAPNDVELDARNPEITNGPLQIDAGGDATVEIKGKGNANISGGQCVKAGGTATVTLQNQTIEGDLEVTASAVDVTLKNTTIEGDLTVEVETGEDDEDGEDAEDSNSVAISGNSTIAGDFRINGDSEDITVSGCSKVAGQTPEACEDDD